MLRRFREYLRREDEIKAKDEVYKEVAAWDSRRRKAEARSDKFTEPPPTKPPDNSQEKQKNKSIINALLSIYSCRGFHKSLYYRDYLLLKCMKTNNRR